MGNVASQVFVDRRGTVYGRLTDCPAGETVQERYVVKTWFKGWQLVPLQDEWRYLKLINHGPQPLNLPCKVRQPWAP